MKSNRFFAATFGLLLAAATSSVMADSSSSSFVYETPQEFFGWGDFDGDGRLDIAIIDKASGKFRLGYQMKEGTLSWVDCRISGIKDIAGFTIGKLLASERDALGFTSADGNQITIVDVSSTTSPSKPLTVPFSAALGPNTIVAIDIGGAGNTPLADLYVASMYNAPDPSQGTLVRNDGKEFPKLADLALSGIASKGNHLLLKAGQPEALSEIVAGDKGDTLKVENFGDGQEKLLFRADGLPSGSDYAVGTFGGAALPEFIFYKPGSNSLTVRAIKDSGPGRYTFDKENAYDLGKPVRRVVTLQEPTGQKLFIIFGEGENGGVYSFDGNKAPALIQAIVATNEELTCAASLPNGLLAFSKPTGGKFSTRYYAYNSSGNNYAFSVFGGLPSLADNDNITIPDIYDRIVSNLKVKSEGEMKTYTNSIPGTRVDYVMVPIPGGEFVMGSPANEPNRKPDEGPQHKVKISPFWMQQYEVTWNEYELFMYPDEEKRMRDRNESQGDSSGDKLADAVTHPSKPYVEMSFGMGKDGYPAISMTQHAANKYCQWLSAKTGEFYRLPTEAEWEYACRAGTTGTYFFGEDASKLPEYGWFEQNSDLKYQKVGKKKPNPWGLYDVYGNVVEWVLDQYDENYYQQCAGQKVVVDPWNKATKPYPHAVRGGSWDDEATMCRSAARRGSDRTWKQQDPQLPKSIWYFSDAQFVGFRIVRPLKVPPSEQMQKYWTSGTERD